MKILVTRYKKQVDQGRVFLHEQPAHAKSWVIPEVREMMADAGVTVVGVDQCMYGLKTKGQRKGEWLPAKNSTCFMTNIWHIAQRLQERCDGNHKHQAIIGGGRSQEGQVYSEGLCRAICEGLLKERQV